MGRKGGKTVPGLGRRGDADCGALHRHQVAFLGLVVEFHMTVPSEWDQGASTFQKGGETITVKDLNLKSTGREGKDAVRGKIQDSRQVSGTWEKSRM